MPFNYSTTNPAGEVPAAQARVPRVINKTAAYTVKASESGAIFTTVGATGAVTFTLPPVSEGPWIFDFVNSVDFAMVVSASTPDLDTLIADGGTQGDTVSPAVTGALIGSHVTAFSDGTYLHAWGGSAAANLTAAG